MGGARNGLRSSDRRSRTGRLGRFGRANNGRRLGGKNRIGHRGANSTHTSTKSARFQPIRLRRKRPLQAGVWATPPRDRGVGALFEVAAAGVAGRVARQEAEDKQTNKKGYDNINGNLKRQHGEWLQTGGQQLVYGSGFNAATANGRWLLLGIERCKISKNRQRPHDTENCSRKFCPLLTFLIDVFKRPWPPGGHRCPVGLTRTGWHNFGRLP